MIKPLCAFTLVAALAAPTFAKPPLRDVAEIDDALLAAGLADEIRKTCPNISARYLKALNFVTSLRDKARDMGYSQAEIDAYRTSQTEKARLRQEGKAYLIAHGAIEGQPDTYCAIGRAEIEKSSLIGSLLRVN